MSEKDPLNKRERKFFGKMKTKAQQIVNDNNKLKEVLDSTQKKMESASGDNDSSLKSKLIEYVSLIVRMISNYVKGVYTEAPWQTLLMLVAGLLYFITPLDAIPDFIPIAGWVDDATILVWLGKCFNQDLANYREWEKKHR